MDGGRTGRNPGTRNRFANRKSIRGFVYHDPDFRRDLFHCDLIFSGQARTRVHSEMKLSITLALVLLVLLASCGGNPQRKQLTLAVVSGVEGEALKQAARDYEAKNNVHIEIAEFPYTNLFEKELIDLKARTGAYDLIMLDDPWFPRFGHENVLTELTPLLQKHGQSGPDPDFIATSLA